MKEKKKKIWNIFLTILMCTFIGCSAVLAEGTDCDGIFGNPGTEGSLASIIYKFLGYLRIAAPILVIVFGSIDLIKAVVASNPDQMKKAQSTLIKRIFIAVGLFFVPTVVNLILDLASRSMGMDACYFKW